MTGTEAFVHPAPSAKAAERNSAIGYLRAFVVVLVVAHHAVLAYHPFAPPVSGSLITQPRWWQAFPISDPHRWTGFSLFVGFNDIFFMALMFFLSGLFVWKGLERKGGGKFLRDRLLRLGLPFVGAAAIVAPLAYYPAYLQRTTHANVQEFWSQWLSLGQWPSGPAWFVWVLLAFDCIAVLLYLAAPKWGDAIGRLASGASRRPSIFFTLLAAVSALVYIPLAIVFSPLDWTAFGPFAFQTSRILNYFLYFVAGVGVGAWGLSRGLLGSDGNLARRWVLWTLTALIAFVVTSAVTVLMITSHLQSLAWQIATYFLTAISCAASSFALLAIFVRFASSKRSKWFDSLRNNSYGIYLVHYAFVSWLQYSLLGANLPGFAKGTIVFLGAVVLSWITASLIRRIPAVGRVLY